MKQNTIQLPIVTVVFITLLAGTLPCVAEHDDGITALSQRQIQDYLSGKGMGLARVAELNGYPGPAHVLELSDELQLTAQQKRQTQTLFDAMHTTAKTLGTQIVAAEEELDRLFSSGTITEHQLSEVLRRIAEAQGDLRRAHLQAHLNQATILSAEQIALYQRLRKH